jgi:hypothetical protein
MEKSFTPAGFPVGQKSRSGCLALLLRHAVTRVVIVANLGLRTLAAIKTKRLMSLENVADGYAIVQIVQINSFESPVDLDQAHDSVAIDFLQVIG